MIRYLSLLSALILFSGCEISYAKKANQNPECSKTYPTGQCPTANEYCNNGVCFHKVHPCSQAFPDGFCDILGASCQSGKCVAPCVAQSCADLGFQCGDQRDNCGEPISCGSCQEGHCVVGICKIDEIEPSCEPKSCEELQFQCGDQIDNCNEPIWCGVCPEECISEKCEILGFQCGEQIDNCNRVISCGNCGDDEYCDDQGICILTIVACSLEHPEGICAESDLCIAGVCTKLIEPLKFEINGTFAQRQHLVSDSKSGSFTVESVTEIFLLQKMERVPGENRIAVSSQYCAIDISVNTPIGTITVPDTYINSIIPEHYYYDLSLNHEGVIRISQDLYIRIAGIKLDDPLNDPLPVENNVDDLIVDDPRVFDQDQDGYPGMSVWANIFGNKRLCIVQRTISRFSAVILDSDRFGTDGVDDPDDDNFIWFSDEQAILYRESKLLGEQTTIKAKNHLNHMKSVRIDNHWDCSDILSNKDIF